jgi:tRNA-splicing ligase RtcB
MCYIATRILADDFFKRHNKKLQMFETIYERIPVGFNSREKGLIYDSFSSASANKDLNKKVEDRLWIQLGTLGGGNHFIEIGENREGYITITIHSGSRNIGHSIASYYMKLSQNVEKDLPNGFLHLNGEHGQHYLHDMNFALEYALANRKFMMKEVLDLFDYNSHEISTLINTHMVNENHNHAIVTGNEVLHRKGATPAEDGQTGIIPGSMKSGVYVTEGLGNPHYLYSASHGAGRKMARKAAKKKITMERFKTQMDGIVAKVTHDTKDEAPDAYKNLHNVIKEQEGIVIKTIDYAKPLINVKG